jgi:hypothetical protein
MDVTITNFRLTITFLALIISGVALWDSTATASSQAPNDVFYYRQQYLQRIYVPTAWETMAKRKLSRVVVAVVDTGVDLNHPDLQDRLVKGVNILEPNKLPQDDHGHGTNVAGVIAAISNNQIGIAGIAQNARIMPIKAVPANGIGQEEDLIKGIRYAVDNGARIVILSLGLHLNSTQMLETIAYAEQKNVLLVAATGNTGETVMYPSAYATVVAVGGATLSNEYKYLSNYGPEIDLIAPWYVFTTSRDGNYAYKEGTSMAAPQVAGIAALLLGVDGTLKPAQLRERLRQSTTMGKQAKWNPLTGYGLIRADVALSMTPRADIYEPNNNMNQATLVSSDDLIRGELENHKDEDWYIIEPPYDGEVSLQVLTQDGRPASVELAVLQSDRTSMMRYNLSDGKPIRLTVENGQLLFSLRTAPPRRISNQQRIRYEFSTEFHIYKDPYEPNERVNEAVTLPDSQRVVIGTFHQLNDNDWYVMNLQQPGSIRLSLETDTPRMDLELTVMSDQDDRIFQYDDQGEGRAEFSDKIQVQPGKYYFRVRNVKARASLPVVGEYTMIFYYEKIFPDVQEPNNRFSQATALNYGQTYSGVFDSVRDEDWFQFRITQRSLIEVDLNDIPQNRYIYYKLMNSTTRQIQAVNNKIGNQQLKITHDLEPGLYYIQLMTDASFQDQSYQLVLKQAPLIAGFRDIERHWARTSIEQLTASGIVKGVSKYEFAPNRQVTRAEAAVIIGRALQWKSPTTIRTMPDVPFNHWARLALSGAVERNLFRPNADGTVRPNQALTRAELAMMIATAIQLNPKSEINNLPFSDVSNQHWAAKQIAAMVEANLLNGFKDGTFKPNQTTTRAELTALIAKLINKQAAN